MFHVCASAYLHVCMYYGGQRANLGVILHTLSISVLKKEFLISWEVRLAGRWTGTTCLSLPSMELQACTATLNIFMCVPMVSDSHAFKTTPLPTKSPVQEYILMNIWVSANLSLPSTSYHPHKANASPYQIKKKPFFYYERSMSVLHFLYLSINTWLSQALWISPSSKCCPSDNHILFKLY